MRLMRQYRDVKTPRKLHGVQKTKDALFGYKVTPGSSDCRVGACGVYAGIAMKNPHLALRGEGRCLPQGCHGNAMAASLKVIVMRPSV